VSTSSAELASLDAGVGAGADAGAGEPEEMEVEVEDEEEGCVSAAGGSLFEVAWCSAVSAPCAFKVSMGGGECGSEPARLR